MSLVDQILGDGAVADLCRQWKDKINSGITLVMATLFWFLLEIMEARFVPLFCSILLLLMLLLFLWAKFGEIFFTRRPPTLEELNQPDSPPKALFLKMEGHLLILYEISYGKDNRTFLKTILYVTIIYIIGSYISLLTILYICLVCSMTIPVLYQQFQEVIDSFMGKVSEEKDKLLEVFKTKVVSKIPRAPKVE
ncbi:Reticulon [Arabidopsis thaliana x Arabidopsis arenosa]|uniref:Reticulon-like protein n=1 Tax=Arabidopsis thaliana x Arabidopsis arenosa TaxID=1240361 RepID=A0A8T1ZGS1_9BRAS|nr:Reticulon [Arabidopsis thaliana x Arabidopsis arenosa]KAG7558359.1 Reticulon [Arabidopsis thaliana x Arabidopsis arenosa]KAG7558365.1 Reticulon [Arabidopsis thaliana x Arabidopsis arenosa]